jgi:hypothetical protein
MRIQILTSTLLMVISSFAMAQGTPASVTYSANGGGQAMANKLMNDMANAKFQPDGSNGGTTLHGRIVCEKENPAVSGSSQISCTITDDSDSN